MDVQRQIAETRAAFAAALERGDAGAVSGVYAEGAKLLAPSAELIEGRASIEAFWRAGIEIGVSHAEFHPIELRRNDGLAYEVGRYTLRVRGAVGPVVDDGTYLLVHERQDDGSWRRVVEMFSPDGQPLSGETNRRHRNCSSSGDVSAINLEREMT